MAYQLRYIDDMDLRFTNKLKILFILIFSLGFNQINFAVVETEGGYSNKTSVFQGETLKFYISTSSTSYQIKIYKLGENAGLIFTSSSIQGGLQYIPPDAYKNGSNWARSFEMVIPNDWEPGVYRAVFPVSGQYYENSGEVIFAVKTPNLGSFSKIAVILTVNNWNAYNNFGGKSLYNYNSTNSQKAIKVSFDRPFTFSSIADFHNWTEKLINWFVTENVVAEYITNVDLYQNPNLLSNYGVVIDVGHDEYVTLPERNQVQNFVNNGGKLMILSGNTYWWQVRLEDNGRTMVSYKDPYKDPELGVNDEVVTTRWYDYPLYNPETKLTGVTFREGGVVNNEDDGSLLKSQGYGDFAVYNSHYWVYNGTDLKDGDEFGYDASIVGVEVDGNDFAWQNGIPTVTGNDQAPTNFRILGLSPADNRENYQYGHGVMGLYYTQNGGAVFTASTINWAKGLPNDVNVQKITHNVLTQFLKNTFPPEIVSWSPGETVSKTINKESVFINDRNNISLSGSSLNFHINAVDPRGGTINYLWKKNGNKVNNSNSSDFIFNNTVPPGIYTITAYAYNSTDTSQISWKVTTENPVTYYSVSGTIVYDNISASPLSNVTVKLTPTNGGNNLTTTDTNGNYSFNNVVSGNYNLTATTSAQFPTNYINATDALLVARYFAGLQTLNPLRLAAADVNNLGGVNATDALVIIRRFANLISTFTKPDWIFETKQISVTNSNLTTQNIRGIATGDVDGSAKSPF